MTPKPIENLDEALNAWPLEIGTFGDTPGGYIFGMVGIQVCLSKREEVERAVQLAPAQAEGKYLYILDSPEPILPNFTRPNS